MLVALLTPVFVPTSFVFFKPIESVIAYNMKSNALLLVNWNPAFSILIRYIHILASLAIYSPPNSGTKRSANFFKGSVYLS